MKTFADTNALVRLYLQLPGHDRVLELLASEEARRSWPLPVTHLLLFEVTNAIHRMVFESRSGGRWRVTPESAALGLAEFTGHLEEGSFLRRSPITLADIEPEFVSLASRHTQGHGFRTCDILHVASASKLRCRRFISFDAQANALARLAGLKVEGPGANP